MYYNSITSWLQQLEQSPGCLQHSRAFLILRHYSAGTARFDGTLLVIRQDMQQAKIDQSAKVANETRRKRAITNEQADLYVAVKCCFGQIRRRHEHGLLVGYCSL